MSFIKYGTKNRDILYATFDLNWVYGGAGNDDLYAGTGDTSYKLFGQQGDDRLFGRAKFDTLDGGPGADRMWGGRESDLYYVDNVGDLVIERAGEGTYDFVSATINYTLTANVEILNLGGTADLRGTGNALDNRIRGNSANNVIDGGRGADEMIGQAGDDTYYVDNVKDKVWEEYNGGYDTVYSSVSIKIPQNFSSYDKTYDYNNNFIERIILIGDQAIDAQGNNLNNVLIGNDAANRLDGQRGADVMRGGLGNDTYVADTGDKVVELDGQGVDTIIACVDWVLGAHIENLTMGPFAAVNGVGVNGNGNGTGNALDNIITGNFLSNILKGAGGNDRMYGGAGNDTLQGQEGSDALWGEAGNDHLHAEFGVDKLYGGAGNDVYWIKSSGHTLKEEAGEGFDQVNSHVTWTLGDNFENLDLMGTADIDATGNAGRNVIRGNEGANVIDGGGGADQLFGEGGADTFVIHNEPDAPDVIAFSVGENLLRFSSQEFGGITKIDETTLVLGSPAQIQPFTAPRFSYDASSGWLSFQNDAQGSFYIAKLSVSTLRPIDFEIVP